MGQDLNYITVNYKNMEKVAIPADKLADFDLYGITTSLGGFGDTIRERRLEADYVMIRLHEFDSKEAKDNSVLYSDVKPYERLKQDKTAVSVTLHYVNGEQEEIYVPYTSKNPSIIADNDKLEIEEGHFERIFADVIFGLTLEFNKEERPYS